MASVSGSQHVSGGKIFRARRTAVRRAPYERPPEKPGWISKLILSPTRIIANGAGKVLSSVFGNDTSSSSSEESDADMDDLDEDHNFFSHRKGVNEQDQHIEWSNETKQTIAKLLLHETFSSEEADRLIHIIKSRVGSIHDEDLDITDPNRVTEKERLPSSEFGLQSEDIESVLGSPIDIAKSYMQKCPPWSSPSSDNLLIRSASPGAHLSLRKNYYLRDRTYHTYSKMHREYSANSWNILDEIRKVRSQATDDMLKSRSTLMAEFSALATDQNRKSSSLVDKLTGGSEDTLQDNEGVTASTLQFGNGDSHSKYALSVEDSQPPSDRSTPELPKDAQAIMDAEKKEDDILRHGNLEPSVTMQENTAISQPDAVDATFNADEIDEPSRPLEQKDKDEIAEDRSKKMDCSTSPDASRKLDGANPNGTLSADTSLRAEMEEKHNTGLSEGGENPVECEEQNNSLPQDEGQSAMTCTLLTEAFFEDDLGTGSVRCFNGTCEENSTQTPHDVGLDVGLDTNLVKDTGMAAAKRSNRRGKGRGK